MFTLCSKQSDKHIFTRFRILKLFFKEENIKHERLRYSGFEHKFIKVCKLPPVSRELV